MEIIIKNSGEVNFQEHRFDVEKLLSMKPSKFVIEGMVLSNDDLELLRAYCYGIEVGSEIRSCLILKDVGGFYKESIKFYNIRKYKDLYTTPSKRFKLLDL